MPTTVNGIGTHYYGKRNRTVRTGVCRSCGRVGNLESYDTRLWFVIVFIPVIPLGRKRVIDSCPTCRRHFVANADDYEQARQLQVSAAQDQYRRDPSPGAAFQVHATLLGFHEPEQAAAFRQSIRERFPDDAELMAGLAAQLEETASYQQAAELYDEAYRIQPDLPEARIAVARRKMAAGELDEARRLLDFLEVPGAGRQHYLGPLDVLSTYFQNQGRHEEALAIAEHLLREIPDAGQKHKFRAFVARSEKALGRADSILPPREHSLRALFSGEGHVYSRGRRWTVIGGVGAALLAIGLGVNNEYIRRHRTIHVVNACGAPVQVRVDDGPPQSVSDSGQIAVGEGRHRIQLSGPVEETHEVELSAGYFDRWFRKPAWVLVPGAEAVLVRHTLQYARNPAPSQHGLVFGRPFVEFPHIDYLFVEPPQSLQVKGNATVTKEALARFPGTDVQAFNATVDIDRPKALDFIERRLRRHPDDHALLRAYSITLEPDEYERAERFLESGLEHRPVSVPWHRQYQYQAERNGHYDGMAARYDKALEAGPNDAALLYLRGRVEPDPARREAFFRRAMTADPKLPWPWEALAARSAAAARWAECLGEVAQARQRKVDEDAVEDSAMSARIASGGARDLANEFRTRLAANPMDFDALRLFVEALAASGSPEDIERETTGWLNRLPMNVREMIAQPVRSMMLHQAGKLAECADLCGKSPVLRDSPWRLHSLLALKRTGEAVDDPALKKSFDNPWEILAVSLAWSLEGRRKEADDWLRRGIARLEKMGPDERRVAAMLGSERPPSPEEMTRAVVGVRRQALACALLAGRFPGERAAFLDAAAKYNHRRVPPYHLIRQAIERKTSTKSPITANR